MDEHVCGFRRDGKGGFFCTGHLGSEDCDGLGRVTGLLKELLITAGGENVAPKPIDDAISAEPRRPGRRPPPSTLSVLSATRWRLSLTSLRTTSFGRQYKCMALFASIKSTTRDSWEGSEPSEDLLAIEKYSGTRLMKTRLLEILAYQRQNTRNKKIAT